jgi:hypothetical protein
MAPNSAGDWNDGQDESKLASGMARPYARRRQHRYACEFAIPAGHLKFFRMGNQFGSRGLKILLLSLE